MIATIQHCDRLTLYCMGLPRLAAHAAFGLGKGEKCWNHCALLRTGMRVAEEPEGASAASLAPSALSGLSSWRGRKARYQNANAGDNLSGKKRKRSKASAAPGTNAQLPVKNFPARGADCPPTPSLRTHVKLQYCSKYK